MIISDELHNMLHLFVAQTHEKGASSTIGLHSNHVEIGLRVAERIFS